MLIRGRYPLSPWQAPNAWDKIYHTVVEESVKKENFYTGALSPWSVKANSYYKWNISPVLSWRMTKPFSRPNSPSSIFQISHYFSSPSCMKWKSFQNHSPSALEIIKSFSPCHRASFGVGQQPPGWIWGGRERWSSGQSAETSVARGHQDLQHHFLEIFVLPASASSVIDLQAGPAYETLSLSLNEISWEQLLWYPCPHYCCGICFCPSSISGLMKAGTDTVV